MRTWSVFIWEMGLLLRESTFLSSTASTRVWSRCRPKTTDNRVSAL
jgi:hypothetical protein